MSRITVVIGISLPPDMAVELMALQMKERRSKSEIIREALRRYFAIKQEYVA